MNRVRRGGGLLGACIFVFCATAFLRAAEPGVGAAGLPDGLYAEIGTPHGVIVAELFFKKTPMAAMSFVGLAEGVFGPKKGQPFFDGLIFHRVVPGFVAQGGDPLGRGEGGPGYTFPDEFVPGLSHDAAGMLSMANTGPDSNGSQFFLTLAPVARLDYLHTVFGRVVHGLEVLPRIQPGDKMMVRIQHVGTEATAFHATPELFAALIERSAREHRRTSSTAETPAHFEDLDHLLPEEPPRARAFNFKLTAFERVTGHRVFVRLHRKTPPELGGRKLGLYVREQAQKLGLAHDGVLVVYVAESNEWKLWIGDSLLARVMGRPGTVEDFMRDGSLHQKKEAILSPAKKQMAAPDDPAESPAQRLKLACDELLPAILAAVEPKPVTSTE
jgi:cyclophilin family peptidyl-prolyl cis-trans isomerase